MPSLLIIALLSIAEVATPWVSDDGWMTVQPPPAPEFQPASLTVHPDEIFRWENVEGDISLALWRIELDERVHIGEIKESIEKELRADDAFELTDSATIRRGPLTMCRVSGYSPDSDGLRTTFVQEVVALDRVLYKAMAMQGGGDVTKNPAANAFLESFRAAAPDSIDYDDLQTEPPNFVDRLEAWSYQAGMVIAFVGIGIAVVTAIRSMWKRPPAT